MHDGVVLIVRDETSADAVAVRDVIGAAFADAEHRSGTEAAIVDALRTTGHLALSLVAEVSGSVVGHAAFSPVTVAGEDVGWFGLGPVAVRPDLQGRGLGAALIREGLARLRIHGARGCVVLGDVGYYTRFGFARCPALVLDGAPPEHFMCITMAGPTPSGRVAYSPAFLAG